MSRSVEVEVLLRPVWSAALRAAGIGWVESIAITNRSAEALPPSRWVGNVEPAGVTLRVAVPAVDPGGQVVVVPEVPREPPAPGEVSLEWSLDADETIAHGTATAVWARPDALLGEDAPVESVAALIDPLDPVIAAIGSGGDRAAFDALAALGLEIDPEPRDHLRSPERVIRDGRGTHLELAAVLAAAFAHAELDPMLAWTGERWLVGLRSRDDRFPEGVITEPARLAAAEGARWIDPGGLTGGGFDASAAAAARVLAQDGFRYVLDLRVSWGSWPPLGWSPEPPDPPRTPAVAALLARVGPRVAPARPLEAGIAERFRAWKERLLDLSLRNRLLAFRMGAKTTVPLTGPDPVTLADRLASERALELVDAGAVDEDAIVVGVPAIERTVRAVALDRAGRLGLEEGGANTVFAALGFLEWSEAGPIVGEGEVRLAPLLLVPVALEIARATRRVRVRRSREEAVANVTLVEKLRRDFGVDLSEITRFDQQERPLDVGWVLEAARRAVAGIAGWRVIEASALAHLTFHKFLVWRDLEDNADRLLENPVVQHIARRAHAAYPNPVPATDPTTLDRVVPASALALPLDADSTQTAAIHSALQGRSFVLQGPPGTGKSQTIANLVAAAIGTGKTVLVVAEKMAALEVVRRRLEEVGLQDAVLELHSHKANKREVIAALAAALERRSSAGAPPWEARSAELDAARQGLNAYVRALHAERPLGRSFFRVSAELLATRGAARLDVAWPDLPELTESRWDDAREHAHAFATAAAEVEPVARHPWSDTAVSEWSVASEQAVVTKLARAVEAVRAAREAAVELGRALSVPPPQQVGQLAELASFGAELAAASVPPGALDPERGAAFVQRCRAFSSSHATWQARSRTVATRWHPSVYQLDLAAYAERFATWAGSWRWLAWLATWFGRRELRVYARKGVPDVPTVARDLAIAREVEAGREPLAEERKALIDGAAGTWNGQDPDELVRSAERAEELRARLARVRAVGIAVPEGLLTVAHPSTTPEHRKSVAKRAADAARASERLRIAYKALCDAVDADEGPSTLDAIEARVERWTAGRGAYRAWALYGRQAADLTSVGLGVVVEAHRAGRVPAVEIVGLVERSVLGAWVDAVRDAEEPLRTFSGPERHRQVARFRRVDQQHLPLGARQIAAAIDRRIPRVGAEVAESSEPGVLLREAAKKTRQRSVRRLLQDLPNLMARLKPCLLMSPLSVAQYLPADGRRFDLVLFDEASQIGTHDAIGALARGAQVVVVGDSRQLPPTTFFQRATSDEVDENDFDELESILDEAIASGLPEQRLGWHYRSRHESLIRFSNDRYYGGGLAVFPAARRDGSTGVRWHPVPDGVYDRARTRTNPVEAGALVEHLVAALRSTPAGDRTFGVVTFSQAQQSLVADLLDEARRAYPAIEPHFTGAESVFVKNLENVQGDERDEILFSIGYGPDASGRVAMNFGPLNREGGERRLNVAVTRARLVLRVFSTLTHDRIDPARTRAEGARHLREFLRYAAEQDADRTDGQRTSLLGPTAFEREVAEVLAARGWEVEGRVGCGSYRIDLAVVHPERPGEYLLGIELDGEAYAAASTARDRERLRAEVLEGLGWRLHRVWSTDWWFDRAKEVDRLMSALDDAIAGEVLPDDEPTDEQVRPGESAGEGTGVEPYVYAVVPPVTDLPALLHEPDGLADLRRAVQQVIDIEAPVHLSEATRRVGAAFGLSKVTARAQKRIASVAKKLERPAILRDGFLWAADQDPERYERVRGPAVDGEIREIEHVPPEELVAAARQVLRHNLSMPHVDLVRETARTFGIARVGRKVSDTVGHAIGELIARGWAEQQGDAVVGR